MTEYFNKKKIFVFKKNLKRFRIVLIRREIKKKLAANFFFGGKWRFSAVEAVPPPFFLKMGKICPKSKLLPFLTIGLR